MAIAKNKTRCTLSLTTSNVERFQSLVKEFGMPSNTMSKACDDIIKNLCGVFEEAKAKGSFGISDLFRVMGTQMELLVEEEKEDASKRQKRTPNTREKL